MRQQQNRPVDDAGLAKRRALVEYLPAAQLEHEILVHLRFGKERLERGDLYGEYALRRLARDAHYVPHLRHLDPDRDRRHSFRRETDGALARTKPRDEGRAHETPVGESVERKRATC